MGARPNPVPQMQSMKAPGAATKTGKTSSYLKRVGATKKTADFWAGLTKMAEKSGKIETIDSRLNPLEPTGPFTGLDMRPKIATPRNTSNARG